MEEDEAVARIVLKLGESKKIRHIPGLENIHPMYEALVSLLKKNIPDNEIAARFVRDENSLREVIATDIFIEHLKPQQRNDVLKLLRDGKSLEEISTVAAMHLSEGKRTRGGNALHPASEGKRENYFFMKALKNANPERVFVETSEMQRIKEKSKYVKGETIAKWAAVSILSATIGIGGYFFKGRLSEYYNAVNSVAQKKAFLNEVEAKIDSATKFECAKEADVSVLETKISERQKFYELLEEKIKGENSSLAEIEGKNRVYVADAEQNKKEIDGLNEKIKTQVSVLSDLEKKVSENQNSLTGLEEKANIYKKDSEKFIDDYKKIARAYYGAGKFIEAEEFAAKAVKINPDDFEAVSLIGSIYIENRRFEDAEEYLQKAIKISPENWVNHYNLAVCFAQTYQNERAVEELKIAISKEDVAPIAYYYLGKLRLETHDKERALKCFRQYLDLEKSDSRKIKEVREKVVELEKSE